MDSFCFYKNREKYGDYFIMEKNEAKKCLEAKKELVKKVKNQEKEVDIPRLASDYLDQTLQIA